jgi:glycosyltransferase involved in cell wall biosynthesis
MSLHTLDRLSVIVPAFNEEKVIFDTIQEIARVLDGCSYEIIVVDDGSPDRTSLEAQRAASQNPRVFVISCPCNMGKGHALRCGFDYCSGELVAFLDADLDLHPRQLQTLYRIMQETGADVVIGSKRHPESYLDYPWHRKIMSVVYFGLVNALFGLDIRDTQTGIKLFRRAVLADAFPRIETMGYAYDLELLVAAMRFGYRIAEAPVQLRFQRQSSGRIGLGSIVSMWSDTLRIFYRASFWNWLHPAMATRIWLVAFVAGLMAASFGAASALTVLDLPKWMAEVAYYITLKFIPHLWRNLSLVVVGLGVMSVALIQLNKSVMKAFTCSDDGDLSGILNVSMRNAADQQASVSSQVQSLEHQV